jgi:hypothetical protein
MQENIYLIVTLNWVGKYLVIDVGIYGIMASG